MVEGHIRANHLRRLYPIPKMMSSHVTLVELAVDFVLDSLRENDKNHGKLLVFVSGPQGSGKSYSSELLAEQLQKCGLKVALCSIDDFYLTNNDQKCLQNQFPDNKLIQGRGLPGTHDLKLLKKFISDLENEHSTFLTIPRYDKSKFQGEGDRVDQVELNLPMDVIIVEGWFLGFQALPEDILKKRYEVGSTLLQEHSFEDIKKVNTVLRDYGELLWNNERISSVGIKISTANTENVYRWRLQQEHALINERGQGMSDEQVNMFVDRYMPCYELYYKDFIQTASTFGSKSLTVEIDENRAVVSHCRS